MTLKTFSATSFCLALILLFGIPVVAQPKPATICEVGNIKFSCPEDFEKLPNVDPTTSLFKFQYKDILVYFFVANPSGKFDQNVVMNSIAGYYPGGAAAPFKWKGIKENQMGRLGTAHEKELGAWTGFDGTHLIHLRTASFKHQDQNVVFGYAWDWGSKAENKPEKFKKGADLGDQSFGCNAVASTWNSVTREFAQARQYCYSTGPVN